MYLRQQVLRSVAPVTFVMGVLFLFMGSAVAALPDNRAYEMVSPVEKGGLSFDSNLAVTDAGGEHVVVDGGSQNALLSSGLSWMLETRTSSGWSGVQVGPTPTAGADFHEQTQVSLNGISERYSRFAFATRMPLDPRDSTHGMQEYVRNSPTGTFSWVSGPPAPATPISEPEDCQGGLEPNLCATNRAVFAGASNDLAAVVWGQYYPLVAPPASLAGYPADTHEHGYEVYESVNGVEELTGLVPSGSEHECGPGSCRVPSCGAAMGNEGGAPFGSGFAPVAGAVAGDGAQVEVVFTSPDPVSYQEVVGCAPPEIYVRENGTTTLQVSASKKTGGDPSGPQEKVYAGSSEEGGHLTVVYFISKEELTEDANTGAADEGRNLYAYIMPTVSQPGALRDLTPENNGGAAEVTFLGASTNGKIVYFTASSVLTAEPNGRGQTAQPGVSNLYVYDMSTGRTTFIASGNGLSAPHTGLLYGFGPEGRLSSEVTPDGQHMLFVSSERLTEYDNFGSECRGEAVNGQPMRSPAPCAEVYLYTAASDSLVCVSCNPSGASPTGSARLPERFKEGYLDGHAEPGTLPAPRAVSDDGSRVFFSSPDRLTGEAPPPTTTRGSQAPIAENWEYEPNVYEYEKGHISLIAPAAVLLTTTPSGNDVFFDTYTRVVPQDTDGSPDVYDARVGGGFPVLAPPACSGSACQGTPAPPTIFATPPSETFTGIGNFNPVRPVKLNPKHCKRGFALRKNRCVKRRKTKRTSQSKAKGKAIHGKGKV